jgi:hypothetical protein
MPRAVTNVIARSQVDLIESRPQAVGVEPVSGHCRTGLRITETEIGKTRAETCAQTSPAWHLLGEFFQPETPRICLTNGNVDGSHTPENNGAETVLAGWGARIRTSMYKKAMYLRR